MDWKGGKEDGWSGKQDGWKLGLYGKNVLEMKILWFPW
jgi:hypothetical protein